ncbi:unnamed protein product, partial [Brassica oleracea]
ESPNVSCLDPEDRRCRDSHKTDSANGRRGETHKSEPFIRKKQDFHRKMKKRSQINETSESLTFKNSVEFDFVRLASCSPDEPKGEKKTNLSFSLCSRQM